MPKPRKNHIEKTGWREIGWFIGLWLAGVITITIVGWCIRLLIMP